MTLFLRRNISIASGLFMAFTAGSASATVTVDVNGGADFTAIQPALDVASEGETVLVRAGEYTISEPLDLNRIPSGEAPKNCILRSDGGAMGTVVRLSQLDAVSRPVLRLTSGETRATLVEGFTFSGGTSGAIDVGSSRDGFGPRIVRCRLTGNSCGEVAGCGAIGGASGIEIIECVIEENDAIGILLLSGGSTTVKASSIQNNTGAGLRLDTAGATRIEDSIIRENFGTGISCLESSPNVESCLIQTNGGHGIGATRGGATIRNSILSANRGSGGHGGESVIELSNCEILENFAPGVVNLEGKLALEHCTVLRNEGAGINTWVKNASQAGSVTSSIIRNNHGSSIDLRNPRDLEDVLGYAPAVSFSYTHEAWAGKGNITNDPLFCQHAIGISLLSPCVGTAADGRNMGALTGSCDEATLDDGEPGTRPSGLWLVSGAPNPFGARSLYSQQAGAEYAYTALVPEGGEYDLQMWWTQWPSRVTSVPVEIMHSGGTETVHVNQRQNGGRWNTVGRWTFDGLAHVTIRSLGGGSTCADAFRLVKPQTAGSVVMDNGQPNTFASSPGAWSISGAPDPFGRNSLYSRNAGAWYGFSLSTALPDEQPPGRPYELFLWWTAYPSRSGKVRVELDHGYGKSSVFVDQRTNGGRWNSIGTYLLGTGSNFVRIFSSGDGTTTCADAVMAVPSSVAMVPVDVIEDTGDFRTSFTGVWSVSGGPNPYGADSLYSSKAGASYTYDFDSPSGQYEVFLWWTSISSRLTDVPVELTVAPGDVRTVPVNQRENGGKWVSIGTFPVQELGVSPNFRISLRVTIRSKGGGSTCADAVRIVRRSN